MGSTSTMKADQDFREQVGQVTNWFSNWSECEQSVALYSLLKKLKPVQAKFLVQVLQQSLSDCTQVKANEEKANDPAFLSQLVSEPPDTAVVHLLRYLPLLQSGNETAKAVFLQVIPKVLSHCLDPSISSASREEGRQLLSYSLIHPAFSAEERNELSHWLNTLEELTHPLSHNSLAAAPPSSSSSSSQTPTPTNSSSLSSLSSSSSPPSINCTCNGVMQNGVNQNGGGMSGVGGMNGWQGSFTMDPSGPPPGVSGAHGSELLDIAAGSGAAASMRMKSLPYNHVPVRMSNSHIGAISSHPNHHTPIHATSSAPPNFGALALPDSQAGIGGQTGNRHPPLRRTGSVVPNPLEGGATSSASPSGKVEHWLHSHNSSSEPHLHPFTSLRPAPSTHGQGQPHPPGMGDHLHAPLSPQSSITSSGSGGSECHHDDGPQPVRDSFMEEGSGMRDVPVWLKQLRLHKYSYLLKQMTYEEMMGISGEWLAARNVTTGARNKIVLSIQKLHERQNSLRQLEKDIMEGAPVKNALSEIKNMLITPIKAFFTPPDSTPSTPQTPQIEELGKVAESKVVEGDLPSQLVRLMGKACTQLLVGHHDDEDFALYLQLTDKCMNHEAFTPKHRLSLSMWRQEVMKNWNPSNHKFQDKQRKSSWGTFPQNMAGGVRFVGKAVRGAQAKPLQWSFGNRTQHTRLGPTVSCHPTIQRNNSLNTAFLNRPGLLEAKQTVTRTHSAPIQSDQLQLSMPGDQPFSGSMTPTSDMEINASLDSLCRQMTEQALSGCDSPDRGSTF